MSSQTAKALPLGEIFNGLIKLHREYRLTKQASVNNTRADKRLQIAEESHGERKRYFGRPIK